MMGCFKKRCVSKVKKITILITILLLLILLQGVLAIDVPKRTPGIIEVDYINPIITIPEQGQIIQPEEESQRIIYLEPEDETVHEVPLQGDVVELDDFSGYYVELGDPKEEEHHFQITFSTIEYEKIIVGEDIKATQTIELTNQGEEKEEQTINLWDYLEDIPKQNLEYITSIEIIVEGEQNQFERPLFSIALEENETKKLTIHYTYNPIEKEIHCQEKAIIDFLPKGATITHTDLALDTPVTKQCEVLLTHESTLEFENVDVVLSEIDPYLISTITNMKTGEKLSIENGVLTI